VETGWVESERLERFPLQTKNFYAIIPFRHGSGRADSLG
jgi:hypothetical protein